ncbi:MAG: tetratricopeptide repeat protein [Ardenticatenaceae bacterium]
MMGQLDVVNRLGVAWPYMPSIRLFPETWEVFNPPTNIHYGELFVDKFIDRTDLLAQVDEAIADVPNNHVMTFVGEGGMGKTALLRRIYNTYKDNKDLIILQLDFTQAGNDSILHIITKVTSFLYQQKMFTEKDVEKVVQIIQQPQDAFLAGKTDEEVEELQHQAYQQFMQHANDVHRQSQNRLLLLIDSVKEVSQSVIIEAAELLASTDNSVIIYAGRPESEVYEYFDRDFPEIYGAAGYEVHAPCELSHFTAPQVSQYFAEVLPRTPHPTLIDTITILTGGKPVLLALTAEWFKHHVQLPSGINKSKEELEALKPFELRQIQKDFEYELVGRVRGVRNPLDKAILYMSFLDRRYDKRILESVLDIPLTEIEELDPQLQKMAFIRSYLNDLPGLLHDEAKRLICQYAWPPYDPEGEERRALARKVIDEFYLPEIKRVRTAATKKITYALSNQFIILTYPSKEERLAHELEMECLEYHCRISVDDARHYLTQLIQEGPSLSKRDSIRHEMARHFGQEEVEVAIARIDLARGQIKGSREVLEQALKQTDLLPWYRITLLYELSDAPTSPAEKAAYLERALQIAKETENKKAMAQIYNDLGLMYRRQGLWNEATEAYEQALELLKSEEVDDPDQSASTLNNFAFVKLLQGEFHLAANLADIALKIRKERKNQVGLAFSYLTKGEIFAAKGDLEQAAESFHISAILFEKAGRDQNRAQALIRLSEIKRLNQEFEAAKNLLTPALQQSASEIRAQAERQLGVVYRSRGQLVDQSEQKASNMEAAQAAFLQSLQTSLEIEDSHGQAQALYELISISVMLDGHMNQTYLKELNALLAEHKYPVIQTQLDELHANTMYENGKVMKAFDQYIKAAEVLLKHHIQKYDAMFERIKDKFFTQSRDTQNELCAYFDQITADLPPESSRLGASLNGLCWEIKFT